MAQRFILDLFYTVGPVVISATASQAGFPASKVRDQLRSNGWRSPIGWTIVAGFNNKIDFTEGGANRVGTIAAGTYATGATMATAVQTAMNTAPGATNTYTVSYASNKFTIARTAGAAALVLKFAAGAANFAASVHICLGYSSTDKSGTSHLAELSSYQSRHAILLDLGSTLIADSVGIASELGYATSLTIQGSASTFVGVGAGATPTFTQDFSPLPSGVAIDRNARILYFSVQTMRYWRVLINRVIRSEGYSEIGYVSLGLKQEPSACYSVEFTRRFEELSTVAYAKGGAHHQDQQPQRWVYGMSWLEVVDADRVIFENMARLNPLGKNFFFTFDSDDPVESTMYGFLRQGLVETFVPTPYWNIPIEFAQALG